MKLFTTLMLVSAVTMAMGQSQLKIEPNITLPKDSIESNHLIAALSTFLIAAQEPNAANKMVYAPEKNETYILLDEVKNIEKSAKFKNDFFYQPYLSNIVKLNNNDYWIQVAYIGIHENAPSLRASFEFIAHKTQQTYAFSSPLIYNTKHWKTEKIGNNTFHYQNTINKTKIGETVKLTEALDKKLKIQNHIVDYYCCNNILELQKLIGVTYKSDYNGKTESVWVSTDGNRKLIVLGNGNAEFNQFDPHDLFHDKLSLVIPRTKVNKPVDEGCAYLYGGSWGYTWKEIFKAFKEQIAKDKNTDWLAVKENPVYVKTGNFNNSADYIVNALLVKKIEKEKGFDGVWTLLNVGPFEKGNEKYFETLEKLTGISKANYNQKVWELIALEK